MPKLLIVDDEQDICLLLKKYFSKQGFEVHAEQTGKAAIAWLKDHDVDVVICDFKLPDYTGLEMLQKIKILHAKAQVIIITGYSDVKVAVEALKKGAFDYVTKPLYPDEILVTVQSALAADVSQTSKPKSRAPKAPEFVEGVSQAAQLVQKHIALIAPTDMSVIILGETGTGKEYVAKSIHQKSKRKGKPFIAVDCGALPNELAGSELFGHVKGAFTSAISDKKGCFELANGGTLFLDEIGNLSYENQVKLLRVLQEKVIRKVGGSQDIAIDVRVLVATNEDLKEQVQAGEFREDMYHRLNEFKIELAPMRQRPDDIVVFAKHFLLLANQQLNKLIAGFEEEVLAIFQTYYWHGNLREMKNVIKRSVLLCQSDLIGKDSLPSEIVEPVMGDAEGINVTFQGGLPASLKAVTEEAEKRAILEVLEKTQNNKSKTAELLDIDRKTLYNKLKIYNIDL